MRRRLYGAIGTGALILALGGCVQATRHSNTMVFGTNTSFGIKVGTEVAQTPSIQVGYNRQEAVILPLVANTVEAGGANGNKLGPCRLDQQIEVDGNGEFAVHPCSLVGINGKALDSYSVLASFGADFDASGSGAKGGLAQYFSTGIAAQLLAATGGASVVATGNAAAVSAAKAPDATQTIQSLYGDKPTFQLGVVQGDQYSDFMKQLAARIQLTPDTDLAGQMRAFETAVGSNFGVATACSTKQSCIDAAYSQFAVSYGTDPAKYDAALTNWKIK